MARNGRNDKIYGGTIRKNLIKIRQAVRGNLLHREVKKLPKRLFVSVDHGYLRMRPFDEEFSNGAAAKMAASNDQVTMHIWLDRILEYWNIGVLE